MAGSQVVRELVTVWGFDIDEKPLKELDQGINQIKGSLKGVGIAVAATAGAIGLLLNEAGKQEQVNVAFETMIGNAEKAHEVIADLQQFAAKTPFTIPGIEQNAKQLLGMGIEVDNLIPTLKALGDVSAGLSVPLERIALNYGQVRAQGKLTGRELRDFAVAGVPLLDTLAKQFEKTTSEVQGMVSAGQVGFKDVEKAFVSMTSEGGRFADLMIKQSKTFKGLISNAQDFGIIFARELGQEILPAAKEVVETFIDWLQANREIIKQKMVEFLRNLVTLFKDLIRLIVTAKTAMDGVVAVFGGWNKVLGMTFKIFTAIMGLKILSGIGMLTKGLFSLAVAWKTMGTAALFAQIKLLAIPIAIGAIVTAIALIAEDIIAFTQGRDSVFGRMLDGLSQVFESMKEKFAGFGVVVRTIITAVLTPIRFLINGLKSVGAVIDLIRGKSTFLGFLGNIGKNFRNAIGVGAEESLSGALGLSQNFPTAASQVTANNSPIAGLGAAPFSGAGTSNQRTTNVNATNEINLNVTGMNPDDAKDLVTSTLTDNLDNMFRETVRDGESPIER